jgi:outer membrane protein assembly factor BamB
MAMLLGTSCGGSDGDSGAVDPGPTPAEMCADGWPIAAAYDRETGGFQWASCTPEGGLFLMEAASDDTVWLQKSGVESEHWELDAATGTVSARGEGVNSVSDVPDDADRPVDTPPEIDGVQLGGGQGVPTTGTDATTGELLWTQPGTLAYGDTWPVGDGAVFAREQNGASSATVAYEVGTGAERWRTPEPGYLWPWHVEGDRLLVMWDNLRVLDTADGSVVWETAYPVPPNGFPRMMGGLANDESVFVSFTSEPSGGD